MDQPAVTEPWQQAAGSRNLRPAASFFRGLPPAPASLALAAVRLGRRDRLKRLATLAKPVRGTVLAVVGLVVLTGLDKAIETRPTDAMPEWLVELTTRY
jgi:hypothetical protein